MPTSSNSRFVSRGGEKLDAALTHFQIDVTDLICTDLGSHVGGFVDCLLQHGAKKVFSVDTSYGTLAWTLRRDSRVVVMERTNAMHVEMPEPIDLVTIDVDWTPQAKVLKSVAKFADANTRVLTLIKPHYEAGKKALRSGVLPDAKVEEVVDNVVTVIKQNGWSVHGLIQSPIRGHGGNREVIALLTRGESSNDNRHSTKGEER